jgi:hypothetical protein
MTTPTITELPLHLEPTAADPFLDVGAECAAATPLIRELDRRRSDGIDVRLLWNQTDEQVVVAVFDAKTGDAFEIEVEGREALDAFHHPLRARGLSGHRLRQLNRRTTHSERRLTLLSFSARAAAARRSKEPARQAAADEHSS